MVGRDIGEHYGIIKVFESVKIDLADPALVINLLSLSADRSTTLLSELQNILKVQAFQQISLPILL